MTLLLIVQGCGGGGSSSSGGSSSASGQALIGLTDAAGDFVTYQVDVTSLTLTKENGAVVETLPLKTSVDFTQLTDMTEFLTAGTVPSGVYTKAIITLDYSNAVIAVENAAGESVNVLPANILDEDGNPITSPKQITIDMPSFVVAPGVPSHLSLDFDLDATNSVTFAADGTPTVTVTPVLKASLEPDQDKIQRLRGPIQDVDVAGNSFDIILRPFIQDLKIHDRTFGTVKVTVDSGTTFNIDGVIYTTGGLQKLAQLDQESPYMAVIAHGQFQTTPQLHFVATEVLAGSSVPGGALDVARGTVISRSGDVITLKGATLIRAGGSIVYNDKVQVTLGNGTKVSRQLSNDKTLTKNDISVGQQVMVFGTLTNTDSTNLQMDATGGFARMLLTILIGSVLDKSSGDLDMSLQAIDWRKISLFDFTGTGIDTAHDAKPTVYNIGTDSLDLSGLSTGTPVKVRGFVNAFGTANPPAVPDFEVQSIVDVSDVPGLMNVGWLAGRKTAFSSITDQGLTLDLTGDGFFHRMNRVGVITDLGALPSPEIVPLGDGTDRFRIDQGGVSQVYSSFSDFVADLQGRIDAGAKVKHVYAWGTFDNAAATLTAGYLIVKLI
ncbi:MAG TPA: metallophosphoesterase [Desulfomonilia bacterium]|nr:metallophosphoesterase [Desulfomonilia bacterium]